MYSLVAAMPAAYAAVAAPSLGSYGFLLGEKFAI